MKIVFYFRFFPTYFFFVNWISIYTWQNFWFQEKLFKYTLYQTINTYPIFQYLNVMYSIHCKRGMLSLVFLYVFIFGLLVFMSCVNCIIEKKRSLFWPLGIPIGTKCSVATIEIYVIIAGIKKYESIIKEIKKKKHERKGREGKGPYYKSSKF